MLRSYLLCRDAMGLYGKFAVLSFAAKMHYDTEPPPPPPTPSLSLWLCFFMLFPERMQVGDWTKDLFRLGLANPSQPLWITAAQPSLVETTLYYDNGKGSIHPSTIFDLFPTFWRASKTYHTTAAVFYSYILGSIKIYGVLFIIYFTDTENGRL